MVFQQIYLGWVTYLFAYTMRRNDARWWGAITNDLNNRILNFLLLQTPVKLRNSQIWENYQLLYNLNYSNFFQIFLHILEINIIWKIFLKYMDPGFSTGWEKSSCYMLLSFSKMNVLLWNQYQVIHRFENLRCST